MQPDGRPSLDDVFMEVARTFSRRATCDRAHVGCVLVVSGRIVSTGYNGSLPGAPHCVEEGHLMLDGHCVRTVHAEMNSLADAARRGASVDGATAFCTHEPCAYCAKALLAAGIRRIVYDKPYRSALTGEFCASVGVPLERFSGA